MEPKPRPTSRRVFQSSLELSPECNGLILACVLDGFQEGVIGQDILDWEPPSFRIAINSMGANPL